MEDKSIRFSEISIKLNPDLMSTFNKLILIKKMVLYDTS